jgi:Mg-chelatase subunit ChlD
VGGFMKNRIFCFCIIIILPALILGQDKQNFDLPIPVLHKSAALSSVINPEYLITSSDYMEIALSREGYFTIGTSAGLSESTLDDNCGITFGHPFAMTSYPLFYIDENWYAIKNYFNVSDSLSLAKEAGSLFLFGAKPNGIRVQFSMVAKSEISCVEIILRVTNLDSIDHNLGIGYIFDPSLGKWGDGHIYQDGQFVNRDTMFTAPDINDSLLLWERDISAKGLGIALNFNNTHPEKIIAANWHANYSEIEPIYSPAAVRSLYDLLLKIYWPAHTIQPDESIEISCEVCLIEPDFSTQAFVRWDLPAFLAIGNGIMFPQEMKTTFELFNNSQQSLESATVNLNLPDDIKSPATIFDISASPYGFAYENVILNAELVYEDKVVEVALDVLDDDILIERLTRNVYIPATPVSDTGLVVVNDSLSVANFPDVEIFFSTEVVSTGQRILDLKKNNIFLYESGQRIKDFSLEKYTGGGTTLADVVFVLDVSGSMGDEKAQIVAYLSEFADSLVMRGYDYQIGLVTFSTTIDRVVDLTTDVEHIKQTLNAIALWGGVEDSPLAIYTASEMSFRAGSQRTIIWITDEEYPEHSYTVEQIVDRMLLMGITVHGVGPTYLQTDWFNPIIIPTGGNFYDIDGNFRDILLDVTRFKSQDLYQLRYQSQLAASEQIDITLEVHYGGLGVIKNYLIPPQGGVQSSSHLSCFPNPFNPQITLAVKKDSKYSGELNIFNILGQRIHHFNLDRKVEHIIIWDGRNEQGILLGSGFYIVQLLLKDGMGIQHRESAKILYLK